MLKLKLQYFFHLTHWKRLILGKTEGRRRRGQQRLRWLDGITHLMDVKFEQALGVGDGQGRLACFSPWDFKELDTTEQLNWTELNWLSDKAPNTMRYQNTYLDWFHVKFEMWVPALKLVCQISDATTRKSHFCLRTAYYLSESWECWRYVTPEHLTVQFSRSVVSESLRPHEARHARPPCPSPTPRVHPNPCPSSQWCHPTISCSIVPFSSCPQSFPAL